MFHVKHQDFDVVVVGGGHAGAEAAHAAWRMGARVCLITMRRRDLGVMSCNPAIGGLGKGHLVREIDAFDGIMGRLADASGIQFRLLNRKKGPAVQGPRTQADRNLYAAAAAAEFAAADGLRLLEAEVCDLIVRNGKCVGVVLADGSQVFSTSVVLTTGTFLRGLIHIGDETHEAGRMGDAPSVRLAERMDELDLELGRLKTGTPPRLDGRTIDWTNLESQEADEDPVQFSFLSGHVQNRQIACGITHTNVQTHEIIQKNLDRSAMYGGRISGTGPRYCPSIEDKIVRFAGKDSHQVFLEPEGLDDHTIYPNGISTSLPVDVQTDYVRSMVGLEQVKILQPGYAIEYDYVDPRALSHSLELRKLPGLYLAGQINGTTGYEEAAAQGLVAGLNAANANKEPIRFTRDASYIGVMIDDLVTQGVAEPYRMFTSRAEFRLVLRADNADQRLTPIGIGAGCVSEARRMVFADKMEQLEKTRSILDGLKFSSRELAGAGVKVNPDGPRRTGFEVLGLPMGTPAALCSISGEVSELDPQVVDQVAKDALYANYVARQDKDAEALQRDENVRIPHDFPFSSLEGLSNEVKEKLIRVAPETLAQAGRIEGMTPAALTLLLSHLRRQQLARGA
ncbi:tRNA uridine-5-carboxymethylaminomethyl(34) synthesis enzyme MnmG [Alphaproteobacteria bacterium KMM 3653]|uniref:tRNA uridine 5-carboxymethylaminomethyl modification enzyme MnmG n=1 Tax=Harenicola maris TaxID=2841044 RepID=A0AAP2CU41_9RHOB|nr:tRNA uridine-5-carboxymethylaminomethyl(34) synthesis enzyme MnmG [Harenicola maris]